MTIKSNIQDIVGKTIASVVVSENNRDPRTQVFLVFDDDRYLELYGDNISCAGGFDWGGVAAAVKYADLFDVRSIKIYPPQPDS